MNILIAEDKKMLADALKKQIIAIGSDRFNVMGICESGLDVLHFVDNQLVDLIFMDIQLKDDKLAGIKTTKKLNGTHPKIMVVYLTGLPDNEVYSIALSQSNFLNFLTKPYSNASLSRTLELAYHKFNNRDFDSISSEPKFAMSPTGDDLIYIRDESGKVRPLHLENIMYIKTDDQYILIYTSESTFVRTRTSLKKLYESTLKFNPHFFQIHRKYLINITAIEFIDWGVSNSHVKLERKKESIGIGEQYRKAFKECIDGLMP